MNREGSDKPGYQWSSTRGGWGGGGGCGCLTKARVSFYLILFRLLSNLRKVEGLIPSMLRPSFFVVHALVYSSILIGESETSAFIHKAGTFVKAQAKI